MGVERKINKVTRLLEELRNAGYDINQFFPRSEQEVLLEQKSNELYVRQHDISIARAEIITRQTQFLSKIEAPFFSLLAETNNNWMKTTLTSLWADEATALRNMVEAHEALLMSFDKAFMEFDKLQKDQEYEV